MLLTSATLEEHVVRLLAETPELPAKDLHARILGLGHTCSLRAVYKELGKLESEEVVYRVKSVYSLRLAWVISLLEFADQAYDAYTSPGYLSRLLATADGRIVNRFTDLGKLDAYWIQVIMALQKIYPGREMCVWCPYQWFYLVHAFTARRFYRAEEGAKTKRYHIIGSDTYLDRRALADLPKSGVYSFAESPFHDKQNVYFTLIGEHLITVKLDPAVTRKIAALFAKVRSERDLNTAELSRIFQSRAPASITIEQSESKSKRIRRQFSEFFGASIR